MLFRNCEIDYFKRAEVESYDSSKDTSNWVCVWGVGGYA